MDASLAHENARLRALLQTQQDTIRQMAEYNCLLSQRVAAYASEINRLKALIGKLPTPEEYQTYVAQVDKTAVDTYRYLNFDQLSQYTEKADRVIFPSVV